MPSVCVVRGLVQGSGFVSWWRLPLFLQPVWLFLTQYVVGTAPRLFALTRRRHWVRGAPRCWQPSYGHPHPRAAVPFALRRSVVFRVVVRHHTPTPARTHAREPCVRRSWDGGQCVAPPPSPRWTLS
jgi:hypothetical protein